MLESRTRVMRLLCLEMRLASFLFLGMLRELAGRDVGFDVEIRVRIDERLLEGDMVGDCVRGCLMGRQKWYA